MEAEIFLDAFLDDPLDVPGSQAVPEPLQTLHPLHQRGTALVLIHGFFGWGEDRPLWGMAPSYYPIRALRRRWSQGPVLAVDVGIASSSHDRACESFAQLMGIQCDYGEEHARTHGHARFGVDYSGKGLLTVWDGQHPVHLVGHSFGGNTALALTAMICDDFWGVGSDASWVVSCVCIASPLAGCSLPFALGYSDDPAACHGAGCHGATCTSTEAAMRPSRLLRCVAFIIGVLVMVQRRWPSLRLFRLRHQQWSGLGKARDEWWAEGWAWATCTHPLLIAEDSMLYDATPSASARALKAQLHALSAVYLVAVTSGSLAPNPHTSPAAALLLPVAHSVRASLALTMTAALAPISPHRTLRIARRFLATHPRHVPSFRPSLRPSLLPSLLATFVAWATSAAWRPSTEWVASPLKRCVRCGVAAVHTALSAIRGSRDQPRPTSAADLDGRAPGSHTYPQQPSSHFMRRWVEAATERVLECTRAALSLWLVRPTFRLTALLVERTAAGLPAGVGLSARSKGSDGLVDTAAQRGLHVPLLSRRRSSALCTSWASRLLTSHHSSEGLETLGRCTGRGSETAGGAQSAASAEGTSAPPASTHAAGGAIGGVGAYSGSAGLTEGRPPTLERGVWCELRVGAADHSLGTALCHESGPMFESVLALLERMPKSDARELMRLRAAKAAHTAM